MDESTRMATRLWTSAQPMVAAFVASIIRNPRDREDVIQNTAMAVFESIETYQQDLPFNAWAIGIARNQVYSYLRSRKRDRLVFSQETIANLQTPFAVEAKRPELDFVSVCISQLEGRARELCHLRYREGLKPAAISDQINMSSNAVAKALQRIRQQLKQCIESNVAAEGAVE